MKTIRKNQIIKFLLLLICLLGLNTEQRVQAEKPKELVFIFQKQKDPNQIKDAADKVGKYLTKELGMPVKVKVPSDYSASVQALISKNADFAYTSSLPFLLAKRDGGAELLLGRRAGRSPGQRQNRI